LSNINLLKIKGTTVPNSNSIVKKLLTDTSTALAGPC